MMTVRDEDLKIADKIDLAVPALVELKGPAVTAKCPSICVAAESLAKKFLTGTDKLQTGRTHRKMRQEAVDEAKSIFSQLSETDKYMPPGDTFDQCGRSPTE